jgi:hypothetical protein
MISKLLIVLLLLEGIFFHGCGYFSSENSFPKPVSVFGPVLHVLFIGNSYTEVNDLPSLFTQLADSGGHPVVAGNLTPGGSTLLQHSQDHVTLDRIKSQKWDEVILQDHSFMPALTKERERELNPGVRVLAAAIRENGSQLMLYLTWGRQKGLPEQGFPDYDSMQAQLTEGYMEIAREQKIPVAPVGEAWKAALGHDKNADLWGPDGSHPSLEGSYLAACVFYAAIFGQTPEGLRYYAGLPPGDAWAMQVAATETVLANKSEWMLP